MEKIKQFIESDKGKDILTVLIVILVGLGSFELGRLSKEGANSGIQIEYMDPSSFKSASQSGAVIKSIDDYASQPVFSTPTNSDKNYFASSRGSKYYPAGCSAGKSLKEENRIYFATGDEAEQAGYELSSSCQ